MKTPKIPAGWRKLRKGEIIQHGDKFTYGGNCFTFTSSAGCLVGRNGISDFTYIRHKQKATK